MNTAGKCKNLQERVLKEELSLQIYQMLLEELSASEQRYRELVQRIREAVFKCDSKGTIMFLNRAWTEILGYEIEECLGRSIETFVYAEDRAKWNRFFNHQESESDNNQDAELRFSRKDGGFVWVLASMHDDGRTTMVGSLFNIHDRRQAEEERKDLEAQLQRAQKLEALGTLAGGIAHDFNNLLTTISGHVSLMLLSLSPSHPHHERLEAIEKQILNASKLTRHWLGYARKGVCELKVIELNKLVTEVADTFGRTRKQISVHLDLFEDLAPIEADPTQVEQVLLNLCMNAADAMPSGGDLTIRTENFKADRADGNICRLKRGEYVRITVIDTGIGMDPLTVERIFDPFFTTKEKGQGTGLGLACAYGIVRTHGGYIDVQSGEGNGSVFNVYIPRSHKTVVDTPHVSEDIIRGAGTLLLVDDEEDVRRVGKELLEAVGYEILTAASGEDALLIYMKDKGRISLVILDMIMPGMNGTETYKRLRNIDPDVKILICSGYRQNQQLAELLSDANVGFIQKPFQIAALSRRIAVFLRQ